MTGIGSSFRSLHSSTKWRRQDAFVGGTQFGGTALATVSGEVGLAKISEPSPTAPGTSGAKLAVVCDTNPGTAKLVIFVGTSTTPVTIQDNIGSGVSGC